MQRVGIETMIGRIYKITNLINNKVYIGQTIQSLKLRWQEHCQNINNGNYQMVIKRAIHKYGKENFTIEEIEICDSSILNEREKYWIDYYNSFKEGYNSTLGGQDCTKLPKLLNKASEIVELYKEGFSLRNLAREFNVNHATIKLILTRNNINLRTTRTYKLSQQDRENIISDYQKGISRKEIQNKYSISKSYLSQLINGYRRI